MIYNPRRVPSFEEREEQRKLQVLAKQLAKHKATCAKNRKNRKRKKK